MERSSPLDVTIIDKDESSEQAYHVVDGFVIEDSKSPFPQNGHLSFMPEDYGKDKQPPSKRTRNHGNNGTPSATATPVNGSSSQGSPSPSDEPLQPGQQRCEFCHVVGQRERFLPPSRRFCSLTCCKRYSAEKRYYPYGRDEQGIAKSIREGLLNPRSRLLRPGANKQAQAVRDQRRRKMAFYGNQDQATVKSPRSSGGKKKRSVGRPASTTPTQRPKVERQSSGPIILEPYSHPSGTPLQAWSVEDVGDFLSALGYEAYLDRFVEHEIDGKALSLVKDHHLLMTLKLRLGPTLKICEHVNAIKMLEEGAEEG